MTIRSRFSNSLQIARIERTRSQRQRGRSGAVRAGLVVCILAVALGCGFGAYWFGTSLTSGHVVFSIEVLYRLATAGFLALLVGFMQRTTRVIERLEVPHLLTTVSTVEAVLGVVGAVVWPAVIWFAPALLMAALGFALGAHTLLTAPTLCLALAGLVALAILLGVALSFAFKYITTRSPRFRRYRGVIVGIGFALAIGILTLVYIEGVSTTGFGAWIRMISIAWFVDLGFWNTSLVHGGGLSVLGALAALAIGIPALLVGATVLGKQVWETEPVSSTVLHRSRLLVGGGVIDRLLAGGLSRPVLTVMRKRWVQERRVPVAVFMLSYLLLLLPIVYLPMLFTERILLVSPLCLAAVLGTTTGLCFGTSPIGTEYSSFSMTLTTISGRHFVRGEILAGAAIGAPITVVITVLLALGSPVGIPETIVVGITGGVLAVCSMALAVANGMKVSYSDLLPAPLPFSSASIYAEIGWTSFARTGAMLGVFTLVCGPGIGGYLLTFFGSTGAMGGISQPLVRIAALLLTSGIAVVVAGIAYQRAVRAFDRYTI